VRSAPPRWRHPETDGPPAPPGDHLAVTMFYAYEAELLDRWRIDQWLELVDPEFVYQVPTPLITDEAYQLGYDTRSLVLDEDRASIADNWAARMDDANNPVSWADSPPVRLLRSVSCVRVRELPEPDNVLARSNVRIEMVRQTGEPKSMVGERFDVLRRTGDTFRVRSRFVVLTATIIDSPRLRILF
jgi:3-phenylpropionate/cinnamic acid dioxygenase small subunit